MVDPLSQPDLTSSISRSQALEVHKQVQFHQRVGRRSASARAEAEGRPLGAEFGALVTHIGLTGRKDTKKYEQGPEFALRTPYNTLQNAYGRNSTPKIRVWLDPEW